MKNEGMFVWDSGHQLSEDVAAMWKSGQPNGYKGRDADCVYVRDGNMGDVPCKNAYESVCQKRISQGKRCPVE